MFRTNSSREFHPEMVNIEDLVPQDHLLRKINETIDFSFIAENAGRFIVKTMADPA